MAKKGAETTCKGNASNSQGEAKKARKKRGVDIMAENEYDGAVQRSGASRLRGRFPVGSDEEKIDRTHHHKKTEWDEECTSLCLACTKETCKGNCKAMRKNKT